jgi:hypothetical protein
MLNWIGPYLALVVFIEFTNKNLPIGDIRSR